MAEHTPTPWQISPVRTTEDTAMIVGGEGFEFGLIADVTEDFDATFIVKACNRDHHFDALVKALEEISSCPICGYNLNGKETFDQLADIISKFNSALQKRVKLAEKALALVGTSGERL